MTDTPDAPKFHEDPNERGTFVNEDNGFRMRVMSIEDFTDAAEKTKCAHGKKSSHECQACSTAGLFHRQMYRTLESAAEQMEQNFDAAATRAQVDEAVRAQCGFLPEIGPIPRIHDLPKVPPINLADVGLTVKAMPIGWLIQRADGGKMDTLQLAIVQAIEEGAAWVRPDQRG